MPAAHLKNKPFLFFVIHGPIHKSFKNSDNITRQLASPNQKSSVEKEDGTLDKKATSYDLF